MIIYPEPPVMKISGNLGGWESGNLGSRDHETILRRRHSNKAWGRPSGAPQLRTFAGEPESGRCPQYRFVFAVDLTASFLGLLPEQLENAKDGGS